MATDGHSAWVNSAALAVAGVTAETRDPPGGRIERDPATRAPTGTLRDSAVFLIVRHLPATSSAEWEAGIRRAVALANSFGITSMLEANADEASLAAYKALDERGELNARVAASARVNLTAEIGPDVARLEALRERYRERRLRVTAAKVGADGVMESRTAALLEPYVGGTDRGPTMVAPEHFNALAVALDRAHFQVHVHAIGDRAVRMALDAIESAHATNSKRDGRHQIAHLELIDPSDMPRSHALDVVANVQPLWAQRESDVRHLTEPVLGAERSSRLYPLGSLVRAGEMLAAGSDWSVSSLDPLLGIQVAVTRRDPEAPAGVPWLA